VNIAFAPTLQDSLATSSAVDAKLKSSEPPTRKAANASLAAAFNFSSLPSTFSFSSFLKKGYN
jgi:hypothetical protein